MDEKTIFIKSDSDVVLEALLSETFGKDAILVAHPHPLYGGNMYNSVVEAVVKAYNSVGYTTIRFNFRGVGRSSGSFDNGIGEREDIKAVFRYLIELEKEKIAIAGYSFGAWVGALCLKDLIYVDHTVFISPPVSIVDFSFLQDQPKIKLVITGSNDYIAPPDLLQKMLPLWNPEAILRIIDGADHFYWGHTGEVEVVLKEFLERYHEI